MPPHERKAIKKASLAVSSLRMKEQELRSIPSKGWAEMIRKVYEVDPMVCPECGGAMKVIAFLTDYAVVDTDEARDFLLQVLDEIDDKEPDRRREKMLAALACKTAIKAQEPLAPDKMDYLVEELFRTANPALCPHGRPIIVKIETAEIEKGLKRSP